MSESQNVVQLEVDKILVPEDRVTSVLDDEILAELEESIRQHGILQPLQVALVNDKYVLIDGLHRMLIAKKLGMKTVPAIVKPMSEDELLITNLIVNRQRGRRFSGCLVAQRTSTTRSRRMLLKKCSTTSARVCCRLAVHST